MSKFFALEMASEVAKHPKLTISHGLLGLFKKATYKPTGSVVESYSNCYKLDDALQIRDLINADDKEFEQKLTTIGKIDCDPKANFHLDLCISHDCRFVAMQLNHVADDEVMHITPIRYIEGKMAEKFEDSLLNTSDAD